MDRRFRSKTAEILCRKIRPASNILLALRLHAHGWNLNKLTQHVFKTGPVRFNVLIEMFQVVLLWHSLLHNMCRMKYP
jgi:hypothetical protein